MGQDSTAQHGTGYLLGTGMHLCTRALRLCIAAASGPLSREGRMEGGRGFPSGWVEHVYVYIHVHTYTCI